MASPNEVPASPASLLLNFSEAATLLGLTVWQVRGLAAEHAFPVVRVAKRLYVRRSTITKWLEGAESRYRLQPRGVR